MVPDEVSMLVESAAPLASRFAGLPKEIAIASFVTKGAIASKLSVIAETAVRKTSRCLFIDTGDERPIIRAFYCGFAT